MGTPSQFSTVTELASGRVRPWSATAQGRRVIAVDGEGNDINGRHAYLLLCGADDRGEPVEPLIHDGTHREADHVRQANYGLPTRRCLDWLLSLPRSPYDLVVGFSFGYDVVKILSDLPLEHLRELAATGATDWEGYRLEYRPRKWFTVSQPRFGLEQVTQVDGRPGRRMRSHVTVWDVFGYFQSSFVAALERARPGLFSDQEQALITEIRAMKEQRGHFDQVPKRRVLAYCHAEVALLAKLVREVAVGTEDMGLIPRSHHGASAIAGCWLRDRGIPAAIGNPGIPESVILASYFGGRFEASEHGRVGRVHAYDLRSAYAAEVRRLPCLAHASARRVSDVEPGKLGVYLVGSQTSGPWAPFPARIDLETADRSIIPTSRHDDEGSDWLSPLINRQVIYAHGGRRWVWSPEVEAARAHWGADAIPVYDGWVIDVECDHEPFCEVEDLYQLRAELAGVEDGRAGVIKLVLTSIYGLLAQSVSSRRRRGVSYAQVAERRRHAYERGELAPDVSDLFEAPQTLCRIWAGLITSGVRARVLKAVVSDPEAIVSVAADGILSRRELPGMGEDRGELGDWSHSIYDDLVMLNNGIYTYLEDGEPRMKHRGFSPRDIPRDALIEAWDRGDWDVYPDSEARAFVGLHHALAHDAPLDVLGQWVPNKTPVSLIPTKRDWPPEAWIARGDRMATTPYRIPDDAESLAYVPHQSWETVAELAAWVGEDAQDDDLPHARRL